MTALDLTVVDLRCKTRRARTLAASLLLAGSLVLGALGVQLAFSGMVLHHMAGHRDGIYAAL